jgi:hypothetical protein
VQSQREYAHRGVDLKSHRDQYRRRGERYVERCEAARNGHCRKRNQHHAEPQQIGRAAEPHDRCQVAGEFVALG